MARQGLFDDAGHEFECSKYYECTDKAFEDGYNKAIDDFANMLKAFIDDNGMKEDGEQFAIFTKHYIDLFAKGLKEQKND